MLTTAVLAQNNFGDTRTGGLAGPMGLFLITVLAIATVLLIRNMNARLRRLPDRFPHQQDDEPSATDTTSVDAVPTEESGGSAPNTPHQDRNSPSAT
ncbi:hypothetical protein [Plantactinospora endophytica]|uniref:Uncharacterized protein n=1 Tax=Plantactinospora endophytica TaxID=673535 RepID=A0ABQ4E411_9ACTN|nr:hypothetical protein [Plantactinospora endophytica]GIG89443.1 hypothetical protein Pen02_43790 [Plantactinospora endophytica]